MTVSKWSDIFLVFLLVVAGIITTGLFLFTIYSLSHCPDPAPATTEKIANVGPCEVFEIEQHTACNYSNIIYSTICPDGKARAEWFEHVGKHLERRSND